MEVFEGDTNIAVDKPAKQSSTDYQGLAKLAVDGKTSGDFQKKSTTHTRTDKNPWWETDLGATHDISRVVIWNRTDNNLQNRLNGAQVKLLDEDRNIVFTQSIPKAVDKSELAVSLVRPLEFIRAQASYEQPGFPAQAVIDSDEQSGWAIAGKTSQRNFVTLVPQNTTHY